MAGGIGGLKRRAEFVRLTRNGRRQATKSLVLQTLPTPRSAPSGSDDTAPARVGFTVSKRVGNAVARNRLKRRLRAAVNLVFPGCAAPGHDYVIVGRRAGLERPFPGLIDDLSHALRKTGCWRTDDSPPGTGPGTEG